MAWFLLYAPIFRAHLWVSWCFSLLLKAVKITGLAARARVVQVWPLAHCALTAHLAAAAAACPKCILCLFESMPSLGGWEQPPVLFLLQVPLDPLQLFRVLWLSHSITTCHTQRHPRSGGPAAAATKADGSKRTPLLTLCGGPSICELLWMGFPGESGCLEGNLKGWLPSWTKQAAEWPSKALRNFAAEGYLFPKMIIIKVPLCRF